MIPKVAASGWGENKLPRTPQRSLIFTEIIVFLARNIYWYVSKLGLVILLHRDKGKMIELVRLSNKIDQRFLAPRASYGFIPYHTAGGWCQGISTGDQGGKEPAFGPHTEQISFVRTNHLPYYNSPPSSPCLYHLGLRLFSPHNAGFAHRWKSRCRPGYPSYRGETTGRFDRIHSKQAASLSESI